jgi:hypothetical protein
MRALRLSELDRRRLEWFTVAFGGLLASALLLPALFNPIGLLLGMFWFGAWIILGTITWHRWFFFVCPSCRTRFFPTVPTQWKHLMRNPYSNQCPHCGYVLPKA